MPDESLLHQSGVNQQGEPFVQLVHGGKIIAQMSPQQARDHARVMYEAAEAAEQDAFIVNFARNEIGMPADAAVKLLMAFRKYRESTTGKKGGPADPSDWIMP